MKIIIIGAGLAGSVAYGAFSNLLPKIFEKRSNSGGLKDHYAVMRLRSPDISKYLGCSTRKVKAYKAAFWDGCLHDRCSINMMNSYSRKVYGSLAERSIKDLGVMDRYLLSSFNVEPKSVNYGFKAETIWDKKAIDFRTHDSISRVSYDICISTMPLPLTLKMCGIKFPKDIFWSENIEVIRGDLNINSEIHQTIYFPNLEFRTYRATFEGNAFIAEALGPVCDEELEIIVGYCFGLRLSHLENLEVYKQKFGKIGCKDDSLRRALILRLTEQFGIYSFGRYAIWKPIRADELVGDIEKIRRMIDVSERDRKYFGRLLE